MSTSTLTKAWRDKAKCLGRPVNDYDLAIGKWKDKRGRAAQLCQGCPVIAECAQDVLEREAWGTVRAGIWLPAGGLMQFQKDRLVDELVRVATGEVE